MTDIIAHNQEILSQLLWAVEMAEAQTFTLLFAECDSLKWRSRLITQFQTQSQRQLTEITLPVGSRNPYHQLRGELGDRVPEVLFVYGLETLHDPEGVLPTFNHARELFSRDFPFPIVFWLTQDISALQSRIAKDWDSWGRTLAFGVDVCERRDWLLDVCDRAFELGLATGAAPYKAAMRELVGDAGDFERAWQAVQGAAIDLTTEAQARLWLLRGLLLRGDHHQKHERYQQSLALWVQCEPSETIKGHHALTMFYTGLWWLGAAKYNRMEREEAYSQTRQLWEQAIALWTDIDRLDLVARFINPLGEVYQRLGAWEELAALTARSQHLHETYPEPVWDAHDLGILAAESALQRQDWSRAQVLATQALDRLDDDLLQTSAHQWAQQFHRGWYLLNRAIAVWHQGERLDAIANLEAAREHTQPKSDPYLYFRILETLRHYYFTQKQYHEAFRVKQHHQTVEFEFGFRAFVGAGRLRSGWPGEAQDETERQGLVTSEINASGREQNIQELVKRVKESRHRLTIIYGASGVGKSSLIRAALLPTLRQETVSTRSIVPVLQTVYTDWQGSITSSITIAFDYLNFPTQHLFNESSPAAQAKTIEAVLQQLRENTKNNLMTVLIFDQFEEFFLAHHGTQNHLPFYQFLRAAMNIPAVKVILAMRSDYLHCLLACNDPDLVGLDVVNHDILCRDRLHYLGKFSPQQAQAVIEQLTHQARFSFPTDLVTALIADLQGPAGQIRPIELQIVGAQLQSEQVGTLAAYRGSWNKERLVEKYLTDIVADCGPEHEVLAWNVLGLLIDPKREVRPIVARSLLVERLGADEAQLDLVLVILHGSRLIFRHQLGDQDEAQFQLIHDYLVEPVRKHIETDLLSELNKAKKYNRIAKAKEIFFESRESAKAKSFHTSWKSSIPLFIYALAIGVLSIVFDGIGLLQTLEFEMFDLFLRSRPQDPLEDRILVVQITEEDLQKEGWPLSDFYLANLLQKISESSPRVIGLNIYRDIPIAPGESKLKEVMENEDILGIATYSRINSDLYEVAPNPHLPKERVVFANIPVDRDSKTRRNLLYISTNSGETMLSLPFKLFLIYLKKEGKTLYERVDNRGQIEVHKKVLPPINSTYAMYNSIDARGYQVIGNFVNPNSIRKVNASDIMNGTVKPSSISDKVIIVGYSAPSLNDFARTPYTGGNSRRISGSDFQANVTSQLLSAALDNRSPVIYSLPDWGECLLVLAFSALLSVLTFTSIKIRHIPVQTLCLLLPYIIYLTICYIALIGTYFIPLVPPVAAGTMSMITTLFYLNRKLNHTELKKVLEVLKDTLNNEPEILYLALEYCSIQYPDRIEEINKFRDELEINDDLLN